MTTLFVIPNAAVEVPLGLPSRFIESDKAFFDRSMRKSAVHSAADSTNTDLASTSRVPTLLLVISLALCTSMFLTGNAVAATHVATASSTATESDPYEIFAQTRHYWESQRYPPMIEYNVAVEVFEGPRHRIERYRSGYNNLVGRLSFNAVSDYEEAHPYYPHGINFGFIDNDRPHTSPAVDFFGVPMLAPNFSFGIGKTPLAEPNEPISSAELIRQIRGEFHDPDPHPSPTPHAAPTPSIPEIAEVRSRSRAYDIEYAGSETIGATETYHLVLRPVRDPGRNRLRELWVDTKTYAPLRLIIALNFVDGPGTTVAWIVTFAQMGNLTYVDREMTLAPTSFERHNYSRVIVAFESVHEVTKFDYDLSAIIPEHTFLMREPCPTPPAQSYCDSPTAAQRPRISVNPGP